MKLLSLEPFNNKQTPLDFVSAGIDVDEFDQWLPDDRTPLLTMVKNSNPEILMVGLKHKIDKEVLDLMPNLKLVATRTTGRDHIDLDYCAERGTEVMPLYGEELTDVRAVPELCVLKVLELLRRDGKELYGKTLGIIGYGRIGKLLEHIARHGFGMEVLKYDTNFVETENQSNAGLLEVVLTSSDVVSLSISSTEENRNFMNREKFELMKEDSYFLNSSRGWLVDNEALKWALDNKLAGAWSDFPVFFFHPGLITTNHQGGKTLESSLKTEEILKNKILSWYEL